MAQYIHGINCTIEKCACVPPKPFSSQEFEEIVMQPEITRREPNQLATTEPSIGQMMHIALEKGISPDSIKALCDAYVQMEDRKNAREFAEAMAEFQRICPPVPKTARRVITKGVSVPYAPLVAIQRHIAPFLNQVGLSYSFGQTEDKGRVTVTCEVRHNNGHSVKYPYTAVASSASGATPDVLTSMATTTAMRRAIALAFSFVIDDPENIEPLAHDALAPEQVAEMKQALSVSGADVPKFLKFAGAESIESITQDRFDSLMEAIRKRGQR